MYLILSEYLRAYFLFCTRGRCNSTAAVSSDISFTQMSRISLRAVYTQHIEPKSVFIINVFYNGDTDDVIAVRYREISLGSGMYFV